MKAQISLLTFLIALAITQEWTKPVVLYRSSDTIFAYVWHQPSQQRNHFLISDGYTQKIAFYYLSPETINSPILVDYFEEGFVLYGGALTGSNDGKRLFALWSLMDRQLGKCRLFGKESVDGGYSWGKRIEFGSADDTFSRRRPSGLYIAKTGRLWAFYLREDGDAGKVYATTKSKDSDVFTHEFMVDDSAKLATNIEPMDVNGKEIVLEYRKWLDKERIATEIVSSRSGGMTWSYKRIALERFKQNITFFAELNTPENQFIASTFVEAEDTNKTVRFTYNLGEKWGEGMSLVPGYVRGVSLANCGKKVLGIYSKEKDEIAFSYYTVNPWAQYEGALPPIETIGNVISAKVLCGSAGGKPAFEALTTVYEKPDHILYLNKAVIDP